MDLIFGDQAAGKYDFVYEHESSDSRRRTVQSEQKGNDCRGQ